MIERRAPLGRIVIILAASALAGCSAVADRSNAGIEPFEARGGPAGAASTGAKYAGWIAGAPATLALAPVGALAWATPWVDLALATDIVTSPSIGMGYAFEAIVGAPATAVATLVGDDEALVGSASAWSPGEPV